MKVNRRDFIKISSLLVGGVGLLGLNACKLKTLRFGWVTDIHYAEANIKWGRYFKESKDKLAEAIRFFNQSNLDFIIETGDFKDQTQDPEKADTLTFLQEIESVYSGYNGNRYHVLGNHDMDSLSKMEFLNHIHNSGIESELSYYSFDQSGFCIVVLDACYKADGSDYNNNNFSYKDTNIPDFEIEWLRKCLESSTLPVLVFVHQRLDGEGDLFVNNAEEVRQLLEKSGKVLAVFQGHDHEGGMQQINHILYCTQKAMVDGQGLVNNSYSVVTVDGSSIKIEGYRKAESYRSVISEEVQI